ncbi:N-(5'-phosphoribosyl)anthranilate isomerase [compost metagenome]
MVRIKICGLTDLDAANAAIQAGADAIGFVFTKSKREISPERARTIISALPPYVTTVGVFVDEDLDRLNEITNYCRLDAVQLHGAESPDYCTKTIRSAIKAIKVREANDLAAIDDYKQVVQGILLDTYVQGATGGTGHPFPWEYASIAHEKAAIILAGGLHVNNVEEAIRKVHPYAVDVSSGVETNGVKDSFKMREFINRVRCCNQN